jgi:GAF domain
MLYYPRRRHGCPSRSHARSNDREEATLSPRNQRLALVALLAVILLSAGLSVFGLERSLRTSAVTTRQTTRLASETILGVAEARGAQRAYISAGQGQDFWMKRMDEVVGGLRASTDALAKRASAGTVAATELEAARTALEALIVVDQRARDYVKGRNPLLASDLIFEDGARVAGRITKHVEAASAALDAEAARSDRRRRLLAALILAGAALSALVVAFLLLPPLSRPEEASPQTMETPAREAVARPITITGAVSPTAAPEPPMERPPSPSVDFDVAAAVCTDLAAVRDAKELAGALGRVGRLLNASGLIVWGLDESDETLRPLITHGYGADVVDRLPVVACSADNLTAAAWRARAPRVSPGVNHTPTALAVPLLAGDACVGVLAAEITAAEPADSTTLSLARIVAAQVATLVAPSTDAAALVPPQARSGT